ncbi:MAG: glycoside hydrolase [Phycisphaerae bacterium]|nr:glycoside hydrolase [Phycisphaerae bacterium]
MKLKSREMFLKSPRKGALVFGNSFYTRPDGCEKMRTKGILTRSDTLDSRERSFSDDNGLTWSPWEPIEFIFQTDKGVRRIYNQGGFVDEEAGCLLTLANDATLPTDDPMEGMKQWTLRYRVSTDGGKTYAVDEQVIQKGPYTPEHPLECVWVGKNSAMLGDITSRPIRTGAGRILVPVQITPIGPDGEYYNPGGGHTYHESAVLIGIWRDNLTIEWDLSQRVAADPAKSTRGCIEPTLAEMPDGRILMVLRGSNDVKPELPGYRWYSVSDDGGFNWTPPQPWTYTNGKNFFSPSSCSQLLQHSNGRCYWLGNLTAENPKGNLPRYPLVIGEVDPNTFMLIADSVFVIDDKGPDDDPSLTLSNFMAHEDRPSGEIVVHASRFIIADFTGDAYQYRLDPNG